VRALSVAWALSVARRCWLAAPTGLGAGVKEPASASGDWPSQQAHLR